MTNKILPDVAAEYTPSLQSPIKWVGMEGIAIPILVGTDKQSMMVSAKVSAFVNLKSDVKGIHMSRLYLLLNSDLANNLLSLEGARELLDKMISSQAQNSHSAKLVIDFDVTYQKPALLSEFKGYQTYPIRLTVIQSKDGLSSQLDVTVPYSSTCPCSAALSRQLLSQAIDRQFDSQNIDKEQLQKWLESSSGSIATPHSQRSFAYTNLTLNTAELPCLNTLVTEFENAIGTPVQTAVKREDEQAFAALNAENLMFCEDAARRLKAYLNTREDVTDYNFKIEHQESLHAHNAVVHDSKYL